jgi:hypothetical protein
MGSVITRPIPCKSQGALSIKHAGQLRKGQLSRIAASSVRVSAKKTALYRYRADQGLGPLVMPLRAVWEVSSRNPASPSRQPDREQPELDWRTAELTETAVQNSAVLGVALLA